jgi:2-(1,2-epoxy-1,2-dihydrophenyl)acetyl-CoA isomerase
MNVIWEQDGALGRVTLNRPDSLNAWTDEFGRELKQVVEGDAADESVRAVLITGAGRGFSSGADLKSGFDPHPDDGMPDIRKELHELYHPIIAGVRRLEKPVVAAVNGPAVGIGASLAFACDLVLAAESSYFGLAFVNIGLMPDGGSTLFVPAAVGKARAFQMALLGERVPAERALEWGLVNYVHPDDRLMDEANSLVEKLAAGPTPGPDEGLPGGRDRLRGEARSRVPGGVRGQTPSGSDPECHRLRSRAGPEATDMITRPCPPACHDACSPPPSLRSFSGP